MSRSTLESKMSIRTLLLFIGRRPEAPPAFILADGGRVLQRGVLQVGHPLPLDGARVVLVVPGEQVTARWLQMPPSREGAARNAARLLMEEQLAAQENLHIAVGPHTDGRRLAVAVSHATLQAWRGEAGLYGLQPDAIVPDALMLPAPQDDELSVATMDSMTLIAGRDLAATCEPDAAEYIIGDRPVRHLDDAQREAAFLYGLGELRVNLLQGEAGAVGAVRLRDWRLAAILGAVLLASPLLLTLAHAVRFEAGAAVLRNDARRQVSAALPGAPAITDPVAQVDERLAQLERDSNGFAPQAAALFAALEDLDGAQLESLIFTPDGSLRTTVSHNNYSDVEQVRLALRRSNLGVREEGSRTEGERLVTDLIVGARQ
ncbi:type II secretion system protein GspL [Caulobacter sp. NIBR2454]|uniref:type II secretion system protein GspL n=1 Tax=Caulobacter sp. NIBR2454 TaxID=3015996 RepID=UPI0022B6E438|nr:type II secretion system protein GspL [Caulobacter sp. NIBR2454]